MLDKNNSKKDFEDTVTDLEFALKRARLYREVEEETRKLNIVPPDQRVRVQQKILILKIQIKEMDQDRLDALS